MKTTVLGFNIILVFIKVRECGSSSGWQTCNDKCFFFGKNNVSFDSMRGFCNTMSGSAPVDLGSKTAQSIATFFQPCRIVKTDKEPYWINKESLLCRTITFDGDAVLMNQNEQCTSKKYPICENEKSFCKASNTSHELKHDWVQIAGRGLYYMLSGTQYTYCYAKYICEKWHSQISPGGNYTYMGLLGTELGITGRMKVDFWLHSSDVSCPNGNEEGTVMQYSGPYVHIAANKSAQNQYSVLCMSDKPGTTVQTRLSTQQTYSSTKSKTRTMPQTSSSTSTQSPTISTKQQSQTSSTSTKAPTTTSTQQTQTSSTSTQAPTTTSTQQSQTTTSTQQTQTSSTSTQAPPIPRTKQIQTSTTSTQAPTTTSTQQSQTTTSTQQTQTSSTSTQAPPIPRTKQIQTSTTSTQAPTTTSTQQTQTASTSTRAPTTTSTQQTQTTTSIQQTQTSLTSTQAPTIPKTKQIHTSSENTHAPTTSTQQTQKASPSTQTTSITQQGHMPSTSTPNTTNPSTKQTYMPPLSIVSGTNAPVLVMTSTVQGTKWVTIGQEEYYVNIVPLNYNKASQFCNDRMNATLAMFLDPLNYFSILTQIPQVVSESKTFWVGAHGLDTGAPATDCLSFNNNNMTLTTLSCNMQRFSVCRRILGGDLSGVLETPEFKTMIREMTVLKNGTNRQIRKLTSAKDKRVSSQATGGVGVFIICSVIVVMLMSDCSGVRSSFFTKKK